jgi:hypothetical protein
MGCDPQSGEASAENGTSEKEDVTGTEGCIVGEPSESESGQGSKARGSGVTEISRYEADHSQEGGTSKGVDEENAGKESGGKEEGSEEVGGEENLPAAAQSVTETAGQSAKCGSPSWSQRWSTNAHNSQASASRCSASRSSTASD